MSHIMVYLYNKVYIFVNKKTEIKINKFIILILKIIKIIIMIIIIIIIKTIKLKKI